jgi:type IV pilus assembly protein PilX
MTTTPPPRRQRGVALIVTLIALLLMMIGAAAMVRSIDTTSGMAGNLAFRRDLANRAERAIVTARATMVSGALGTESARIADRAGSNYSSSKLPSGATGVPLVLTSNTAFASAQLTASDLSDDGVSVRYVIDRQCVAAGAFDPGSCESLEAGADSGGSNWLRKPGGTARPVYRISVRVSGPRDTQAFFQTTFAY